MAHLRAAGSRLQDKPFLILSVSLDDTKAALERLVNALEVPGIQIWDEAGRDNPIADLYNARALPVWYLIDAQGVIRARNPFGERLLPEIEAILNRLFTP